MTTVFLGQIELFAFGFAPRNWAQCNGQLLAISTNEALFSVLGTTYGGDGIRTFALPDLRGRVPLGFGTGFTPGQIAGEEAHLLTMNEMFHHNHLLMADSTTAATSNGGTPTNTTVLGNSAGVEDNSGTKTSFPVQIYNNGAPNASMAPQAISAVGNGLAHENRMPFLVLNFCIALSGVFPSRN